MGQLVSTVLSSVGLYSCPKSEDEVLYFKKLTELAIPPTRGSSHAAGYDLYSAYDTVIPASGKALVKTDIAVAIPVGCYGRVAPR
jgi:dUTP pyrophosphatase